jgi:hypothetical protein
MTETPTDVLAGGCQEIDKAAQKFESLVAFVSDKQVSIEGVIPVTHAQHESGAVRLTTTTWVARGWSGRRGRACGWLLRYAGAGRLSGRVAGGVIGESVDHRVEQDGHGQDRREAGAGSGA